MAGTVNKVILVGRLGADPDMRYSADGTSVMTFNVATDEPVRNAEGLWDRRAEWHRVVAFGKVAENRSAYLGKGRLVYVEGKLRTRQWDDSQGVKRYTTEIVARDIVLLSSGGEQPSQGSTDRFYSKPDSVPSSSYQQHSVEELPPSNNIQEDDIPF